MTDMSQYFFCRAKKTYLFLIITLITVIWVYQKYPFGVRQYETIMLGMSAAQGAGTPTVWGPPHNIVPEANFYVYAIDQEPMCIGDGCGLGGYFVECLGGWMEAQRIITEEFDYGLKDAGVDLEKQSIITIADKDAKIVGVYAGAHIRNLPYIMRKHRNLVKDDKWQYCSEQMPMRMSLWPWQTANVKKYQTIELGMDAAEKGGDQTIWGPLYSRVPDEAEFYVYSLGDQSKCRLSDCGLGAYFVECLHGWISGYKNIGEVADYGLGEAGVDINKERVITIANKDAKIVGIYPGARIRNLPFIMRRHRDLVDPDTFAYCSAQLPRWWK